jgi:hypothetical protein
MEAEATVEMLQKKVTECEALVEDERAWWREQLRAQIEDHERRWAEQRPQQWPEYVCVQCHELYPSKVPFHGKHPRCASCRK